MKIRLFFLFTLFFLLNAGFIAMAEGPQAGLNNLGNRLLSPLESLNEQALEIIEDGGIIFIPQHKLSSELFNIWKLLSNFWVVYFWLAVLSTIIMKVIIWDDSKGGTAWLIAIFVYLVIQMLYLSTNGLSIWFPIEAVKNIWTAIPYIIDPIANIGENVYISNNTTQLINNTLEPLNNTNLTSLNEVVNIN